MSSIVEKSWRGFRVEHDFHTMYYDPCGVYVGQEQPNMLDDSSSTLFFKAELVGGLPAVDGVVVEPLSAEQMHSAK